MVRDANRGAVIQPAGGERRLGQRWVCGGQIPPLFKYLSPERTPGTSVPAFVASLSAMVRKADRGVAIQPAGGERRLGQGWVCGGQIPPLFKYLSPERTPGTSVPTCVLSLSVMVRKADRGAVIQPAGGERRLGQGWVCGGLIWSPFAPRPMPDPFQD